jgi:hypothetical protein
MVDDVECSHKLLFMLSISDSKKRGFDCAQRVIDISKSREELVLPQRELIAELERTRENLQWMTKNENRMLLEISELDEKLENMRLRTKMTEDENEDMTEEEEMKEDKDEDEDDDEDEDRDDD